MGTTENTDLNLILQQLREVQEEVKLLRAENAQLKNKAGIRRFVKPLEQNKSDASLVMDTSSEVTPNASIPTSRKPPPFYVSGIKSASEFSKMLKSNGVNHLEMKGLANSEMKVTFNSSDDYRSCRTILSKFNDLPEEDRKNIGQVKYHTYQLREEKPFTVFIRGLHHSVGTDDITAELAAAGHEVRNIVNVHSKRRHEGKVSIVKLALFKVDLKVCENNRKILDLNRLCDHCITIEYPRQTKSVPQCMRCLDIGHTANYCTKPYKCLRCGDNYHVTKNCKQPKDAPPRCANCKGTHTANYRGCPYYQSKLPSSRQANRVSAVERIKSSSSRSSTRNNASYAAITAAATTVQPAPVEFSTTPVNNIMAILERMEASQLQIEKKAYYLRNAHHIARSDISS
jgi:hypothetical protein